MRVEKVSESDLGILLFVEGAFFAADVRVGPGLWPRISILAFAHRSGVPGATRKEDAAIRCAVKRWLASQKQVAK